MSAIDMESVAGPEPGVNDAGMSSSLGVTRPRVPEHEVSVSAMDMADMMMLRMLWFIF